MPLGFQRLSGKGVLDQVIEGLWSTSAMWHVHRVSPVAMEAFDDIKITLSLSFMEADLAEIYAKVLPVCGPRGP
jgi:molybdenum cofactor biosynthesis enzyme MoaA